MLIRTPQRATATGSWSWRRKTPARRPSALPQRQERLSGTLVLLQGMLGLREPPRRLEAYDISNIAGTDIVASMTVFEDGKPKKSDYKARFQVRGLTDQDDYASMRQVLCRRSSSRRRQRLCRAAGRSAHRRRRCACRNSSRHAFGNGRVSADLRHGQDNRHRTRALVTPDGQEISIQSSPAVFALIGRIQEGDTPLRHYLSAHPAQPPCARLAARRHPRHRGEAPQSLLRRFPLARGHPCRQREGLQEVLPAPQAQAIYDHFHGQEQTQP